MCQVDHDYTLVFHFHAYSREIIDMCPDLTKLLTLAFSWRLVKGGVWNFTWLYPCWSWLFHTWFDDLELFHGERCVRITKCKLSPVDQMLYMFAQYFKKIKYSRLCTTSVHLRDISKKILSSFAHECESFECLLCLFYQQSMQLPMNMVCMSAQKGREKKERNERGNIDLLFFLFVYWYALIETKI